MVTVTGQLTSSFRHSARENAVSMDVWVRHTLPLITWNCRLLKIKEFQARVAAGRTWTWNLGLEVMFVLSWLFPSDGSRSPK